MAIYHWKWTCPECGRLYADKGGRGYRSSLKLKRIAIVHLLKVHGIKTPKQRDKRRNQPPPIQLEKMGQVRLV